MGETILLVVLIVVLFLITVSSVIAMVKLRRKTNSASTESIDAGFDICISELNKMGSLIKSDIDAKYKEILFLYDLIEDKHKQIEALVNQAREDFEFAVKEISIKEVMPTNEGFDDFVGLKAQNLPKPTGELPRFAQHESDLACTIKPDHKVILQMSERGLEVADIAKELGIGQGEVKLILNIAGR